MNGNMNPMHLLWIIPAVIVTESAAVLRMMRGGKKNDKKGDKQDGR